MAVRIGALYLFIILFNNAHTAPRLDSVAKSISSDDTNNPSTLPLKRGLKAGDTFTPNELLPITEKLIKKVDTPGQGKGIVSLATSPEDLADKLFKAFFLTERRIVLLQDFDISGLDALQALALSGKVPSLRNIEKFTVAEEKQTTVSFKGQNIILDNKRKTCRYKLVTKSIESNTNIERRGINLAQKLATKRRLIVNSNRRHLKENTKTENQSVKVITNRNTRLKKTNNNTTKNIKTKDAASKKHAVKRNKIVKQKKKKSDVTCHWQYECSKPTDLDSCRLHTKCVKKEKIKSTPDFTSMKHKSDEHSRAIKEFRKMFGISLVDEEVEKILEKRIIHLKLNNKDNSDRIESLGEYFDKIIMAEFIRGSTTPMNVIEHNNMNISNKETLESDGTYTRNDTVKKGQSDEQNEENRRMILGIPTRMTYKPENNK